MSLYLKFENIFWENMCNTPKGNIKELQKKNKKQKFKNSCMKGLKKRLRPTYNHAILNKKYLGACLYLAPVRSYGLLNNDEKNQKDRISS